MNDRIYNQTREAIDALLKAERTGLNPVKLLVVGASSSEIAGGGTHCVVLTDRGRAFAFGDNESGQCNVGDWHL